MSEVNCNPHLYALIAGEVSGDTLGAGLMKAILRHDPEAKFIGIGGPKMIQCGLVSYFNMDELSVMGIFEVVAHAVPILKIRSAITKILLKERPCILIGIDSPDFNLTVERALKQAGIKTIHYVSPSVWAWREKRIVKIKASCDEVLALLPFEKEFYDRHEMPCTYVGHTLANSIAVNIDQSLARERSGLYKNCVDGVPGKVLAILPGSRKGIIGRMLPIYARTAALLHEKIKDLTFISIAPNRDIALLIKDIWLENCPQLSLTVFVGNTQDVIASADACLLTCGTIAFEAMLLKCPMVVAYKVSRLSAALARRLLKVNMYSLPNLLAKREIVKELIQEDCTPIKLAHECIRLLTSDNLLMKKEFLTIHESIKTNTDELAARAVMRQVAHIHEQMALELNSNANKLSAEEQALDNLALTNYAKRPQEVSLSEQQKLDDKSGSAYQNNNNQAELKAKEQDKLAADSKELQGSIAKSKLNAHNQDKLSLESQDNEAQATKSKLDDGSKSKAKNNSSSNLDNAQDSKDEQDSALQDSLGDSIADSLKKSNGKKGKRNRKNKAKDPLKAESKDKQATASYDLKDSALNAKDFSDLDDVPLKNGLDDKTVQKLEKEVKEQVSLSLNEVLSMPNMSAGSKNRAIIKRVTERI